VPVVDPPDVVVIVGITIRIAVGIIDTGVRALTFLLGLLAPLARPCFFAVFFFWGIGIFS